MGVGWFLEFLIFVILFSQNDNFLVNVWTLINSNKILWYGLGKRFYPDWGGRDVNLWSGKISEDRKRYHLEKGNSIWSYTMIQLDMSYSSDHQRLRMEVFEIDTICWLSAIFTFRGFGKQGYQCTGTCIRWPIIGQCSISVPLENVHKPVASWRFDGNRDEHWHEMD